MPRPMQGPALDRLRRDLRNEAAREDIKLDLRSVAERLPFSRQTLIDIGLGRLSINTETSQRIHDAIMAGVATASENGKR